MPRDDATLLDLSRAGQLAREFVAGMDKHAFLQDVKTQSAVVHQILVLGEAAKRLSAGFRDQHPEIPWTLIAGMRDRLIHHYDSVDLDQVWNTLQNDIPTLLTWLAPLLKREES
jgi:uncharacterized protein with HEPN domain